MRDLAVSLAARLIMTQEVPVCLGTSTLFVNEGRTIRHSRVRKGNKMRILLKYGKWHPYVSKFFERHNNDNCLTSY